MRNDTSIFFFTGFGLVLSLAIAIIGMCYHADGIAMGGWIGAFILVLMLVIERDIKTLQGEVAQIKNSNNSDSIEKASRDKTEEPKERGGADKERLRGFIKRLR